MLKWLLDMLIEMLGNIKKFMWNYCLIADCAYLLSFWGCLALFSPFLYFRKCLCTVFIANKDSAFVRGPPLPLAYKGEED